MKKAVFLGSLSVLLLVGIVVLVPTSAQALSDDELREWNKEVRKEKFDLLLPEIMRARNIDMWIHVMRLGNRDSFGAEELGSTSGVFVFTDRGVDHIERAVLGRRWGATQRERGGRSALVEDSGAYDIIAEPVRVHEPVGGPMSEYDFRFEGLGSFVQARDPKRIAVNFKQNLGPWVTYQGEVDGISHTDYLLLAKELGSAYAERLVSSEYLMMDYITRKVPSEIGLIKKICEDDVARIWKDFETLRPGITGTRETPLTTFRRMVTGESQRGRSSGWENAIVLGGDIIGSPERGIHAYVLRAEETEPPPAIAALYAEYLTVERILAENIRAGLTPREIVKNYTRDFEEAGFVLRGNQLHMAISKNDYPAFSAGFDPAKTQLSIDSHSMMKGARDGREIENYLGPRIGSLGPDWSKDIPLPPNHHFVLEYFFYMPSPAAAGEDQYLLFWNHEEAIATERGVAHLSPPQKELHLIK